ncbi:interleukin-17 receptor A [Protopterus annectens]|uniref:interleukin-17 receptor A n=1 Tax=Protopterus annectens TaxID=7888 RepID=UPI001CFB5966|nr:interleukin-17 receptor A [Protopterus annectens]
MAVAFYLQLMALLVCTLPSGLCIQIIEKPPDGCSQMGLNCTLILPRIICVDKSWFKDAKWTPSPPKDINVRLQSTKNKEGHLIPVLLVTWRLATDASISYAYGSEISVLKHNTQEHSCVIYNFTNGIKTQLNPYQKSWTFSFAGFVAEPGSTYNVSVYNLPRPNFYSDKYDVSKTFSVPDCSSAEMKEYEICIVQGSKWNPEITYNVSDGEVHVSFISSSHSLDGYRITLSSHMDRDLCNTDFKDIPKVSLKMVTVKFSTKKWKRACCNYFIQIQPFFIPCRNDCVRYNRTIECPTTPFVPNAPRPPEQLQMYWLILCIIGVSILLCFLLLMIKYLRNKGDSKPSIPGPVLPPPLKTRKVLIIYSKDHPLYVKIVLKFTEFLRTVCGTDAILDLLNTHEIAKMGPIQWLTHQKTELESSSSKILILCSRGTRAKWNAMLGEAEKAVLLKQDQLSPVHDMFTPALNLILPDFKKPACFGKYIIAYFEDVSCERDIPEPFNVIPRYRLMKHFEEIYFRIQDLELHEPGKTHRVEGIGPNDYFRCSSGSQLLQAIQMFQNWQSCHPDWFKDECLSSEVEELDELDVSSTCDPLLPVKGVAKTSLVVNIPGPFYCNDVRVLEPQKETMLKEPQLAYEDGNYLASQNKVTVSYDKAYENIAVCITDPLSSGFKNGRVNDIMPLSTLRTLEDGSIVNGDVCFPYRNDLLLYEIPSTSKVMINSLQTTDSQNDSLLMVNSLQPADNQDDSSVMVNSLQTTDNQDDSSVMVSCLQPTNHQDDSSVMVNSLQPTDNQDDSSVMVNSLQPTGNQDDSLVIVNSLQPAGNQDEPASHLSNDVKKQLEDLQRMLFIGSLQIPREQSVLQDVQYPLYELHCETLKGQRESLQSDQGYISRCSSQLLEVPVDATNDSTSQQNSPDALEELRKLQQLLFQESQQSASPYNLEVI